MTRGRAKPPGAVASKKKRFRGSRVDGFRPSGGGAIVPYHRRLPPEFLNRLCHPVGTRPLYEGNREGEWVCAMLWGAADPGFHARA